MRHMPTRSRPFAQSSSWKIWLATLALFATAGGLRAENQIDDSGRLERLALGKGWVGVRTDVLVPSEHWKKILSLGNATGRLSNQNGGKRTWTATLSDADLRYEIQQDFQEYRNKVTFKVKATSRSDADIEGVVFWIDVPSGQFAGGTYRSGDEFGSLPRELPDPYVLSDNYAEEVVLADRGEALLRIELSRPARVLIQDSRKWGDRFSVLVYVRNGNLPRGRGTELEIDLMLRGRIDETPARVTLHPGEPLYRITGMGGNYCFNTESPITRYTLENLKVAFARTEMSIDEWEPVNDDADSAAIEWKKLIARDTPGSKVRQEFELMREFSARKTPYITSTWRLAEWMYVKPPESKHAGRNQIAPGAWPEVLESIGSYLLYAREKYAAEPDYFSFNEPNLGIQVLMDEEEHRDALKRVGAHFQKLGLKTRLLLGDVASARDTEDYVAAAAQDAGAMQYVGALSFHSWNGAAPAQYGRWAKLARELKLPLIVAEAGVDPHAWKDARFHRPDYAPREMAHYQELFLHARPQAVLYWEFTGDYALLAPGKSAADPNAQGAAQAGQLTERFCLQKHWCDLLPPGSEAFKASSNNASVTCTAFRFARAGEQPGYTLHLANQAWARKVRIDGIPPEIKTLNAVRTGHGELFRRLEAAPATGGSVTLELPALSLTSLTTEAIPELRPPK